MRDYESKENVHPDWEEVYHRYVEMVYRTCAYFLKHPADAEDAVQTVFLRFLEKAPPFQEEEHCKAWLLVTASNVCRDVLRRKKAIPLEAPENAGQAFWRREEAAPGEEEKILEILLTLPLRYKQVMYLYYYEGYSCEETAALLKKNPSTVRTLLRRGREKLKIQLAGKEGSK